MMLTKEIKNSIDKSVLCWLATTDQDHAPNVSPKEMFTWQDNDSILIANIASPNSIKNISFNPAVCVSFVDVFVQKGYKLKGVATIIGKDDPSFPVKLKRLTDLFSDRFPIQSIIQIVVSKVETIQAPSYFLFPGITEDEQRLSAMATYRVKPA